jgi:SAM-dependent methyltransferase
MKLLRTEELERSDIVANCRMNRERQLAGTNSYSRDLKLDILAFLRDSKHSKPVKWIDLCCGTGRALLEAAAELERLSKSGEFQIEGVDLAGLFLPNDFPRTLELVSATIETWEPTGPYALATCVHGLHYLGDKLAAIAKIVRNLTSSGLFLANLDLANFRKPGGKPAGRMIAVSLRECGLVYDTRTRLLICHGRREVDFRLRYLGADDSAGPNYTGQPAVDAHYELH